MTANKVWVQLVYRNLVAQRVCAPVLRACFAPMVTVVFRSPRCARSARAVQVLLLSTKRAKFDVVTRCFLGVPRAAARALAAVITASTRNMARFVRQSACHVRSALRLLVNVASNLTNRMSTAARVAAIKHARQVTSATLILEPVNLAQRARRRLVPSVLMVVSRVLSAHKAAGAMLAKSVAALASAW